MDDDLHDIDDLFYKGLEPKSYPPSGRVWENINAQLDEDGNKKKPAFITLKRMLAMSAVLLAAFFVTLGYNFYQKNDADKNKSASNQRVQTLDKIKPSDISVLKNNRTVKENKIENKDSRAGSDVAINKNRTGNSVSSNLQNKKQPLVNTDAQASVDIRVDAQKKNPVKERTGVKKLFKDFETNANSPGGNSKARADATKGFSSDETANSLEKNTTQDVFEIDARLLLNSPIVNDISIPKIQQIETPLTSGSNLDTLTKLLNLQAISNRSKPTLRSNTSHSRWYVSLFGAQEWQGNQLQDNDDHQPQQNRGNDKNSIKHREDEDPSPAAGINAGYQINKTFSLETGIRFGGYHIRTDSAKIFAENNNGDISYRLITSSGYAYLKGVGGSLPVVGDSITAQKVKQSINYIGIPIMLRYSIGKGRLTFNPALGLELNFITKSTVSADLNSGQGNDLQHVDLHGLNNFSAVVMFNPSVYYKVSQKTSVGLEPYFNYSISPINNTNVVKSYPYGLGLGAGIKYRFAKNLGKH